MSVGTTVLRLRQAKGLTQGELGRRASLATSYVSRIENDHVQPTMGTLRRLAAALELPVASLFDVAERGDVPPLGRCPVSASGQCIGEQIRSGPGKRPRAKRVSYGAEELRILRMADYLALHGSKPLRRSLALMLEALMSHSGTPPPPARG